MFVSEAFSFLLQHQQQDEGVPEYMFVTFATGPRTDPDFT